MHPRLSARRISLIVFMILFVMHEAMQQGGVLADETVDPDASESEDQSPNSDPFPPPPRGNAEFIGVTHAAQVTQRFEMYSPHSREALQELKEMGFTQVILDWPNLHRDATEIGLNVVLANWWNEKTTPDEIDRTLEVARQVQPGRLAGISVMDEPERNSPDTPFSHYIDLYEQLRPRLETQLPGVNIEISHWGPLAKWDQRYYDYFSQLYEAADVMRIMPYPDLQEGPLDEVYLMMSRSRELMKLAQRELPMVVILQTWILPPENKLPEMAELRIMAWQAMLGGAQVISFFDYNTEVWNQTAGFHAEFVNLMQELTHLSRRLDGATIESCLDSDGILHAKVIWSSLKQSRITINTNRISQCGMAPLSIVETDCSLQRIVSHSPPCASPARRCQSTHVPCIEYRRSMQRLYPRRVISPWIPRMRGRIYQRCR